MIIVDAQAHIWGANTPERPWAPNREAHRDIPMSEEELRGEMDAAGVQRCMLVPPSWEGNRNELALEAARLHPDRFAVMGRLPVDAPDARNQLIRWREQPGMMGLRFTFSNPRTAAPLIDGSIDWVWEIAEKSGIPAMVSVTAGEVPVVGEIARRHPALKLIMDHCALYGGKKDEAAFAGLDALLAISDFANVAVKASALPCYTTDSYPYRWLHPHLKRVYEAFGARRIFWGSDLTRLPCTYRQAVTMFTDEMPWITANDLQWIMGRGLCEWVGWPLV